MGDQAEKVFEDVFAGKFERTGFNRPKNISMSSLPATVRYMPDYITDEAWYEVQGFGQDLTCKFKVEKFQALTWWDTQHPVKFFLWSSHYQEYCVVDLDMAKVTAWAKGKARHFPEGKDYFAVPASEFTGWVKYVPGT